MKTHKDEVREAKLNHKEALKNKETYGAKRDELLKAILESRVPKWGGINVIVLPL